MKILMSRQKIVIQPESVAEELYLENVLGARVEGEGATRVTRIVGKDGIWGRLEVMHAPITEPGAPQA